MKQAGNQTKRRIARPQTLAAAAVLLLSGCAAPKAVTEPADTFPSAEARQTFSVGFRQISDRFIEKISVRKLAIEGLKGLGTIDGAIHINNKDGIIQVRAEETVIRRLAAPDANDADAWSRLTVDAIGAARQASSPLGEANVERLYEAVFNASISLLDPFSRYSSAEKASRNRERRSGFGGIGVRFTTTQEGARITEVFDGAPSARAGLKPDDLITHVNSRPLADVSRRNISKMIKGAVGSTVELRLNRGSAPAPIEISIRRARIISPTVYLQERKNILFLQIKGFNKRTARQLSQLISSAKRRRARPISGLVLDLRSNPGGLLSQAVRVADLFLSEGRIVSTLGRHPASLHDYNAHRAELGRDLPMVVLVNGRSASASEIVAAALQDQDRALVIGSASFGKGTVQTVIPLPNKGELILTWSRFITPSGYFLNGLGVPPFICTSLLSGSVSEMVDATVSNAPNLARMIEQWRMPAPRADDEKKRLKSICPATDLRPDRDAKLAEYLIGNRHAYQRIMSLSPAIASAIN
jgi:carboxyl-terminal processing protease